VLQEAPADHLFLRTRFALHFLLKHQTRDRCYDFKNIFTKFFGQKNWRFMLKLLVGLQKFDHKIGF
jgi:hypothetical protein